MKKCIYTCDMCGCELSDNFGEKHLRLGEITTITKAYKSNQPADLCYACWKKVLDNDGRVVDGKA